MNRKNNFYGYKSLEMSVKDIDTKSGIVVGYFAAFNNKDSGGDIIRKGAFTKSINERGVNSTGNRKIKHLFQHDVNKPIGLLKSLEEDSYGLKFESKLSESTLGQDVLKQYHEGILNEHSIGFNAIKEKYDKEGGFNEIKEVLLWEGSTVTFGANPETPVTGFKSQEQIEGHIEKLNDKMNLLIKALRNGTYSDETMIDFEIQLKQIQQSYNSLISLQPSSDTNEVKKSEDLEFDKKQFYINLLKS